MAEAVEVEVEVCFFFFEFRFFWAIDGELEKNCSLFALSSVFLPLLCSLFRRGELQAP